VGVANPFVNASGMPILVSVEGGDFDTRLDAGLEALGGLDRLVGGALGVLINPNFNMAEPYPGISRASSIVSLVERVRPLTAGSVVVADEGYDSGAAVAAYLGLHDPVAAAGGSVETFTDLYDVRGPSWGADVPDFRVFALVHDAPIIISLCNLKRHYFAGFTIAIKNNVGTVSGSGMLDTRRHLHYGGDPTGTLVRIAACANPDLFVVDAETLLTRRGPSYYDGDLARADRLVLCGDMVATDAYCIQVLDRYDATFSADNNQDVLLRAAEAGLGQPDLSQVEIREISV
jgi:uncharacterized protein (DUF362 family)